MNYKIIYFQLSNGSEVLGLFPSFLVSYWEAQIYIRSVITLRMEVRDWQPSNSFYSSYNQMITPIKDSLCVYALGHVKIEIKTWEEISHFINHHLRIDPTPDPPVESLSNF